MTITNYPARSATSDELIKFRSSGDFVKLGLAIQHPAIIYQARINQTFDTLDGVYELIYDGGSGTLANVLKNMVVFIGSSAGTYDKGICRVRQLPTSTILYISETSDIQFADNDYITIIDAMPLWPRDITDTGGVVMMDYDIEFGNYQNGGVIPRIGPLVSVLRLTGATVNFNPVDPSLSAAYDGATIVSYLYAAPGASATSGLGTTSPTFTYDTPGEYRWSCTITDDLGRTTTAYRRLFVNPAALDFVVDEDPSGDYDSGYWSFKVTCHSDVTLADVYDRALVTLYAERESFGGVEGSIGKIAGYENIMLSGWIDGDNITYDRLSGDVTFTVWGPGFWLDRMRAFPLEILDTAAAPTSWKEIQELTVDKALAHIVFWTSTAPTVMDCFFTGDTTRIKDATYPSGSLLSQIKAIALNKLFAKPLINNYGQMYVEIDQQLISSANRAALPVVMDITEEDWLESLDINRNTNPKISMVDFSAYIDYDGVTSAIVYSRAPGKIPKVLGEPNSYNNYITVEQDECNRISGDLLAMENYEYEPLEIELSGNNRLIDIAPRQYCTITIAEGDTVRGITLTTKRIIPRRVTFVCDKDNYFQQTNVVFEFETVGVPGVSYYPITVSSSDTDLTLDDFTDFPPDNTDFFPAPDPVETPCSSAVGNFFGLSWSINELRGEDSTKLSAFAYFPCKIRATGGIWETYLDLSGTWFADAKTNYNVYGIKGGARILTASVSSRATNNRAEFSPLSDTEVDGFEIALNAGLGSPVEYVPGSVVSTGSVLATNSLGQDIDCVTGQWYSLEAVSGHWRYQAGAFPLLLFYNFWIGPGHEDYAGIGYTPTKPPSGGFSLQIPAGCSYSEQVGSSNYGRTYFLAGGTTVNFCVSDFLFGDNDGSLGYALRNAEVRGRRIQLGGLVLHNVCAI